MNRSHNGDTFDGQTCLCCMCRCGDHKCFQQLALKLPIWMQNELKSDKEQKSDGNQMDIACEADLYHNTTYKRDFCEQQDVIDRSPLEQANLASNLKPFSKYGYVTKDSIYRDDFIPWSREEQELYRAKLHLPDHMLSKNADGDTIEPKTKDQFYSYYCPAHCVGDQKPQVPENCLIGLKDKFNLGPPAKRTNILSEKSPFPFEKFSNYMLDFKRSKISPKNKPVQKVFDRFRCPLSSDTSYRSAFTCPPKMDSNSKPTKKKAHADSLTVGDGPMIQETASMLDYTDCNVAMHKPVRPPREVFQPPPCRMETTTTTGRSYPKWEGFLAQEKPKKQKPQGTGEKYERDVRRLVTTYQEDYDGLNSALCPCRVIEKYGPKVLEPHYNYTESENLHDVFRFNKGISEPSIKICPH